MPRRPPPAIVVDDFIGEAGVERLLRWAIAHESEFEPSKVSLRHGGVVDESRRVSRVTTKIEPVLPAIEPVIRQAVDEVIPKLGLVNVDPYLLEPELAWSGDGGFFKTHVDSLYRDRLANQRVLTMVHYFHRQPKAFTGGHLRLYGLGAERDTCIFEVEPRLDRAVFFPAWLPHEVLPVHCQSGAFADGRFAISCWVRKNVWRI